MVNQRILPPTFPRYTKIKDRMLSMNFLDELVKRIKMACKIIYCNNYHSALVKKKITIFIAHVRYNKIQLFAEFFHGF